LGTRPLGETSKAQCGLDLWLLGTERGRLGLDSRTLGISLIVISSEFRVRRD
jgi:hypothetical protein